MGFHVFLTRAAYFQSRSINICLYNLMGSSEIPKTKFRSVITFSGKKQILLGKSTEGLFKVV